MKIAVVGASSFIGRYLFSSLEVSFGKNNIIGTYFQHNFSQDAYQLDIQNPKAIQTFIASTLPDAIFWVAGNKNLKITETNLEDSRAINTYPLRDLVKTINSMPKYNPRIIFFSTDYVFDGQRGLYTPTDAPHPTTNYGISNYEAELELSKSYDNYLIFRTSAVMGKGGTFYDFLIDALTKEKHLELFDNIFFSPTPIYALVESIPILLAHTTPACLHLSANFEISRYDFGLNIQKALNYNKKNGLEMGGGDTSKTKLIPTQAKEYFLPNLSLVCSDCFFEIIAKYQEDYSAWIK